MYRLFLLFSSFFLSPPIGQRAVLNPSFTSRVPSPDTRLLHVLHIVCNKNKVYLPETDAEIRRSSVLRADVVLSHRQKHYKSERGKERMCAAGSTRCVVVMVSRVTLCRYHHSTHNPHHITQSDSGGVHAATDML